jgi:hypothetical protein
MKSLNRSAIIMRFWLAMGARTYTPIVSKGGGGDALHGLDALTMGVKGGRVVLQSAPVRDAAGSPLGCRVCRRQPERPGRGTSNTRPYNYIQAPCGYKSSEKRGVL